MNARLLGFGALAVACVTAAGTGAYVAVRQNAAQVSVTTGPAPSDQSLAATTSSDIELAAPLEAAAASQPATTPSAAPPTTAAPSLPTDVSPALARPTATRTVARPPVAARPAGSTQAPSKQPTPSRAAPPPADPVPDRGDPPVAQVPLVPVPLEPADTSREAPVPEFEDLVVPAEAVIGLQVENSVSSETARVEDTVSARVTRDVRVAGQVAIAAGSRLQGSVVMVVRGGKFKERARLGVRFHTLITSDGVVPVQTETVFREGDSRVGESSAKVSAGAIGGAIIGAIVGGGRGAAIGSAAGAGAGTAAVAAGDRSEARLAAGSSVTVRLAQPVVIQLER